MAAMAEALTAAGAGKSGNPCDRLTPPCRSLSRVISRMTDSVNCVAFFDPVSFDMSSELMALRGLARLLFLRGRRGNGRGLRGRRTLSRWLWSGRDSLPGRRAGVGGGVLARRIRTVAPAIVLRGGEELLHVVLGLWVGNVVDEFLELQPGSLAHPAADRALAGIVAGERQMQLAEFLDLFRQVRHPDADIRLRVREQPRRVRELERPRNCPGGPRHQLREPDSVRV